MNTLAKPGIRRVDIGLYETDRRAASKDGGRTHKKSGIYYGEPPEY